MLFSVHLLHQPEEEAQLIEVKFLVHDTHWLFCFGFIFAPVFVTASVKFATKTDIANKPIEIIETFTHSFIPLACAEFDDFLPFSGASSIPPCYVLFPATVPHQLFSFDME